MVFLVSPQSSKNRIKTLVDRSHGFVYAVSSNSTTGSKDIENVSNYLRKVKEVAGTKKVLTGFNIKDKHSFELATRHTDGGIIGSAFLEALDVQDLSRSIKAFISSIRS